MRKLYAALFACVGIATVWIGAEGRPSQGPSALPERRDQLNRLLAEQWDVHATK